MSRQEFLETLRRALARELSESEVADNINYYWNYIEQQIAGGKTEKEVLAELGDPRLIARTILQVDQKKAEEDAVRGYRDAVYSEDGEASYREDADREEYSGGNPYQDDLFGGTIHVRKLNLWDWVKIILVILVIGLVIGAVFKAVWLLLPYLLTAGLVLWVYRKITGR